MDYRVVLRFRRSEIASAINCFRATARTPPVLATATTSFSRTSSTTEARTQQDSRTRHARSTYRRIQPRPRNLEWVWHSTERLHFSPKFQLLGTANTFRGFLIQAREGAGNYIGSFTNLPALTQTLDCDASNPQATVTHMNPGRVDFTALNFTWEAPSDSDGTVTFMYTVVQVFDVFHVALDAAQERPPSTVTPAVVSTTVRPLPSNFVPPIPPNNSPEDYRLTGSIPAGCTPTVDCSYFVGIQTNKNSSFLDIYLEGDSQGWIAVGFTDTPSMFSADVVGCNRMDQTDEVYVVHTWNVAKPYRNNELDPNQAGVFTHSTEFNNGNISCSFSRYIGVVNPNQSLDLNGDYFLLFGRGPRGGGNGSFTFHSQTTPIVSVSRVNPVITGGVVGMDTVKDVLIRAHGILMIIAYPILVMTAIFFASWIKPALPNGEWFQVHRAFNTAALFIAAVGLALIFVAFRQNSVPGLIALGSNNAIGTVHFIIGIIVIALHFVNPIMALFRCKPDDKNRWIFKLVHGYIIGLILQALAFTNTGIGLFQFSPAYSRFGDLTIFWVYLAFPIFYLVLGVVLVVIFMILPCFTVNKNTDEYAPILTKATQPEKMMQITINEPPKTPSKDARLRWIALGVLLVVVLPLMVAIIVLVALPQQ